MHCYASFDWPATCPAVKATPLGFGLLSITEGKTDLSVSGIECLLWVRCCRSRVDVSIDIHAEMCLFLSTEFRSCVKVEVAVLGSPS